MTSSSLEAEDQDCIGNPISIPLLWTSFSMERKRQFLTPPSAASGWPQVRRCPHPNSTEEKFQQDLGELSTTKNLGPSTPTHSSAHQL